MERYIRPDLILAFTLGVAAMGVAVSLSAASKDRAEWRNSVEQRLEQLEEAK